MKAIDEEIKQSLLDKNLIDNKSKIEIEKFDNGLIDSSSLITITRGKSVRKLVYKQFSNSENSYESIVYKKILSKDIELHSPEILNYGNNSILMTYIENEKPQSFSTEVIEKLINFLDYKNTNYKNCISKYPFLKQRRYIFRINPYLNNYINQNGHTFLIDKMSQNLSKIIKFSTELNYLPKVLEHGDLGYQNILISNGDINVIDWSMANYSNGLQDIIKITESFEELKVNYNNSEIYQIGKDLTNSTNINELIIKETFFQLLRDLNFFTELIVKRPKLKFRNKNLDNILLKYIKSLELICQILF